jgi:hypothetical protein
MFGQVLSVRQPGRNIDKQVWDLFIDAYRGFILRSLSVITVHSAFGVLQISIVLSSGAFFRRPVGHDVKIAIFRGLTVFSFAGCPE